MTSKKLSLLALGMVLLGAVLVILSLRQTIPVQVDGETRLVQSSALTVGGVLRDAKINITENDSVSPPPGQ
ncbi:MAG TPA: ubiquitin-like domain-containing protein, partial [Anaerolineaceae bacterium]|nr:ubiquitin-like domain-containing protein [Anaerolineaceae bacterium]